MITKNSNYLVFADEAGDIHLDKYPREFPIFVLAFMIISKDEYCDRLLPKFARLKLKYFPDVNTIFHERDIKQQKGDFKILVPKPTQDAFMTDLSALMQEIDYKIVAVVIDKDKKVRQSLATDNLYESGVKYGLEQIEKFLESQNDANYTTITFEARSGGNGSAPYKSEDKALYEYFQRTAKEIFGISIQGKSAGGYGLQFADMIARPIGIHCLRPDQRNRAWEIIESKICPNGLVVLPA
jgi:hypothetical protein